MGRPRPKRASPLPLALLSLALLLLPSAQAQRPKLFAALLAAPLRWSADGAWALGARLMGRGPESGVNPLSVQMLETRVQELQSKVSDLQGQVEALSGVRGFLKDGKLKLLPAYVVVSSDSNAWRRSMILLRGSADGVRPGQLVLWERHLIGRVVEAASRTCRVQLVTDSGFRVGAVAQPKLYDEAVPLASRDLGVLEGGGDGHAVLKWMSGEALVEEGSTVVTAPDPASGIPRGLILGRVSSILRGRGLYPRVEVAPFLNLRALDSVVIALGEEP